MGASALAGRVLHTSLKENISQPTMRSPFFRPDTILIPGMQLRLFSSQPLQILLVGTREEIFSLSTICYGRAKTRSSRISTRQTRRLWLRSCAPARYSAASWSTGEKSGESYIAEKSTPVRNTEGQVTHITSNDKDITEQRRLEGVLYHAQKMDAIGQLAGGVAHDFNNLLMLISGYAELMRDSIGPEHPLHRNVQEILKASRGAADLTRQLLAFGRKQTQTLQMLDLNGILTDISKMLPRLMARILTWSSLREQIREECAWIPSR